MSLMTAQQYQRSYCEVRSPVYDVHTVYGRSHRCSTLEEFMMNAALVHMVITQTESLAM